MSRLLPNVKPRHSACSVVVLLTLATALVHICALPFHAHARTVTTHQEPASHHAGGDAGEDAVHAASCDAVRPPSGDGDAPALDAVALAPAGTASLVTPASPCRLVEGPASLVAAARPLFLLHAVLLI